MHNRFLVMFLGVVLSIFVLSTTVFAAHPLITDDAGTTGAGKTQIEFNFEYSSHKLHYT
jgi:uncharacterized membrane protein